MQRITNKKFELPKKLMGELYEATGGGDKYKGFFLIACDEQGNPNILCNCDSVVTELGLLKALEKYLEVNENSSDFS
jgi:hypothetical protein